MTRCAIDECERSQHARGMCKMHYNRVQRGTPINGRTRAPRPACAFPGCERLNASHGLCVSHAWQRNRGHQLTPIVAITADTCSVDDCDRPPQTRGRWAGMCRAHARQARTTGRVQPIRDARPIRYPERFWDCVDKRATGCWEWKSNITPAGYGTLNLGDGRYGYAHRFSWELMRGPIPDGLTIDHLCRNTKCVNPEHLEPVTQAENNRRAWAHRRKEAS